MSDEFYQLPNGKSTAFYLGPRGTVDAIETARRKRERLADLPTIDECEEDG